MFTNLEGWWVIHESAGWKPDWFIEMKFLVEKKCKVLLKISHKSGVKKQGDNSIFLLVTFLWIETIFPFFHSDGHIPARKKARCIKMHL